MTTSDVNQLRAWLGTLRRLARDRVEPASIALAVARSVGERLGRPFPERGLRLHRAGNTADLPPIPAGSGPALLGQAYESTLDIARRRRTGAHFTPPHVARRLAEIAVDGMPAGSTVCDPACGGGAFLLAAGDVLAARDADRRHLVENRLWGVDLDPLAVAVTDAALYLWSGTSPGEHLITGDALALELPGFDVVIGNPPFLNQLERATVRDATSTDALRRRFGRAMAAYVDTAWVFLVASLGFTRPGGRVVLIQPQSLLGARDAAGVRREVLSRSSLEGMWIAAEPVFTASVRVCAPVLRVGGNHRDWNVRRWSGRDVCELSPADVEPVDPDHLRAGATWASLAAGALGVPPVNIGGAGRRRLGEVATATAGFRAQFYGLIPFVVDVRHADDRELPRLVTSGAIDPGRLVWGERPVRFGGRAWAAPRIDFEALRAKGDPAVARWVEARLVPKVAVATQTRVIEAAVDLTGGWVPSTPVIAVVPAAERLHHLAAVLLAPPVTAWALRHAAGTALATGAVKLAARQVLDIPLPEDAPPWDEAARLVARLPDAAPDERRRLLLAAGERMTAAYRLASDCPAVLDWWAARLQPA